MKGLKIAEDVYWVGAIDWDIRNFHGYSTPRGTSYNSYLITDERTVLVDTVKEPFFDQMVSRIESVVPPEEIDLIVSNHVEMDHSGSLLKTQELTGAEIVASEKGVKGLSEHFPALDTRAVSEGDKIGTGDRTLTFIETPMLHWPDSMFTYLVENSVLFSMDGFGQHYASLQRFDDQVDESVLMYEAAKYYANILMPFNKMFFKALDKVKDFDIEMIATSHGIIWRSKIDKIVQAYISWANGETKDKAVVVYDTMWGSTKTMARNIAEGIATEDIEVQVYRVSDSDRSVIMKEILDASAVVVGSPTLNNGIFPDVADFVIYMRGLRPKGRLGAAFGSYGWGGGAVKEVRKNMELGGLDMPLEDFEVKYVPHQEVKEECIEYGKEIASKIRGRD